MWVLLGLISALFLGFYDSVRKKVLQNNPVIPVLFLASLTGALMFVPLIALSHSGHLTPDHLLFVPQGEVSLHLKALLKSLIVGTSWFLAYNALSKLPLTIVVPIRATGPMWTLLGAIIFYSERFSSMQWMGIVTVLGFFYYFTLAGRHEGIVFLKNKWIFVAIGATLVGAVSGLYDKYLLARYDRMFIQAWYAIYMIPILLPYLLFLWYPKRKIQKPLNWTFIIPLIGVLLVVSDFVYFYALSDSNSLIAILSVIRRSSVIISFAAGALFFGEGNLNRKGLALAGILIGVVLIIIGTLDS